ncbi:MULTISPECIES: TlpA disulfide reductase family protein [Prevotellaceae]|jgi:peroxiredoxin|uniref:TlpA disulfide reductase family protein n=1 Tax=Prevotellaceae TaxID=171552 RepID=UPI00033F6875|nr:MULTISPECIES: TlpA disulfide reductase family protein [Prevotella]MBS5876090.1 AhpC/TSA family protein [Prevotella sp.]CCX68934.1 lipoprotein [Prevotella sp. CAG:255]HJH76164.1 AhpC/TSA family protein [Prevotellaceae bacterium]
MKKTFSSLCLCTLALMAAMLTSCNNKKFHINGTVTEAKDSVLYLENMSLDGPVVVDSVKLDDKGAFSFSGKAPDAPEFYRLRIAGQIINLSVDSTETVDVKASYPSMATGYTVDGSAECATIRELALKQIDLQNRVIAVQNNPNLGYDLTRDSIGKLVAAYKEDIKRNYIYKAPMRASSYFALFQTLGNMLIFNPRENADDVKVFAAVATSWDTYHPDALRGKNLHNIAIEGMKNVRIMRNKMAAQNIDASKVNVSNIIDISLLDNQGNRRSLTDLKGKVVMLDFHVFGSNGSTKRIMEMRELYNKYHDRGFEIYQVAFDPDEHFWKTQTAALPWISVRDPQGLQSQNLAAYNVSSIPTFFLIDRNNEVKKRDSQITDIDAEINALLN